MGTTTGVLLDLLFVFIFIFVLLTLSVPLTLIILAALPVQILIYLSFGPFLRRRLRTISGYRTHRGRGAAALRELARDRF